MSLEKNQARNGCVRRVSVAVRPAGGEWGSTAGAEYDYRRNRGDSAGSKRRGDRRRDDSTTKPGAERDARFTNQQFGELSLFAPVAGEIRIEGGSKGISNLEPDGGSGAGSHADRKFAINAGRNVAGANEADLAERINRVPA